MTTSATWRHAHRIHPRGSARNPPIEVQNGVRIVRAPRHGSLLGGAGSAALSHETISPGKGPAGIWHQPSVESPFRCILTRIFNRRRLPGCAHRTRLRSTNPTRWCLRRGETALQACGDDSPTSCPMFSGETMPFLTARIMPIVS
jgi:hypothetical protein